MLNPVAYQLLKYASNFICFDVVISPLSILCRVRSSPAHNEPAQQPTLKSTQLVFEPVFTHSHNRPVIDYLHYCLQNR